MKYNEIKNLIKYTKAPSLPVKTNDKTRITGATDFIEVLKKKDIHNSKMMRRFYVFYLVVVVFYLLLFVANPDKGLGWQERVVGLGFIGALLVYVYYFKIAKTAHLVQDYNKPTLKFLSEAEKRYRFWNKKSFILIPAFILIDVAASFSFFINYYPVKYNLVVGILISQIIFIAICLIGFLLGLRNWKKRNGPVYENIVTLLNSFSNENPAA